MANPCYKLGYILFEIMCGLSGECVCHFFHGLYFVDLHRCIVLAYLFFPLLFRNKHEYVLSVSHSRFDPRRTYSNVLQRLRSRERYSSFSLQAEGRERERERESERERVASFCRVIAREGGLDSVLNGNSVEGENRQLGKRDETVGRNVRFPVRCALGKARRRLQALWKLSVRC